MSDIINALVKRVFEGDRQDQFKALATLGIEVKDKDGNVLNKFEEVFKSGNK